jgi:anti-sigma-K factor RskA
MNYNRPELGERLAADYVLGLMPPRARRRFERAMAGNATLAAAVAAWSDRLSPLDDMTAGETPPAYVWRAIERRIAAATPAPAPAPRRAGALTFWRGLAATAVAACAALVLYIALYPAPQPKLVAVLSDSKGDVGWVALSGPRQGEVRVASIGGPVTDTGHSLELWGIAGGPPKPLGLLRPEPDRPLVLSEATIPAAGAVLAISQEPVGGSPTGLPTGPVLYQGKVLGAAR